MILTCAVEYGLKIYEESSGLLDYIDDLYGLVLGT